MKTSLGINITAAVKGQAELSAVVPEGYGVAWIDLITGTVYAYKRPLHHLGRVVFVLMVTAAELWGRLRRRASDDLVDDPSVLAFEMGFSLGYKSGVVEKNVRTDREDAPLLRAVFAGKVKGPTVH